MIKWGIIGLGRIATRFLKSLSYCEDGYVYAGASYTPSKREEFQQNFPQAIVYQSYDDLLADDQIDVVYIAIPHAFHYQWAKKALLKNKAVLCEKPASLSYDQTKELCHLSQQHHVFFMEGMKTRFIPLIHDLKKLLDEGIIGDIVSIETSFCSQVAFDPNSYLFDQIQGGAFYDVAIYNIASILDYLSYSVCDIETYVERASGVDVYDHIKVSFDTGQTAIIEVAIDRQKEKQMRIIGTQGTITATPFYRPIEIFIEQNGKTQIYQKPYVFDDFYTEIQEVHRCLANHQYESSRMSHQDSLDCMVLMERIKEKMNGKE